MVIRWWRRLRGLSYCELCLGKNGVRGNENIIIVFGRRVTMCDYCHAELKSYV